MWKINFNPDPNDLYLLSKNKSLVSSNSAASAASPVRGEDGSADVAVGGHGCQFPPGENDRKSQSQEEASSVSHIQRTVHF